MRIPTRTWSVLPDIKVMIKAGVIFKPVWFNAAVFHPPPNMYTGVIPAMERPRPIIYPEDRLRNIYLERNRDKLRRSSFPLRFLPNESVHLSSPADVFAVKQLEYMRAGYTERAAYAKAERYLKEKEYAARLEIAMATKQAQALNPHIPSLDLEEQKDEIKRKYILALEKRDAWQSRERRLKLEELIREKKYLRDTEITAQQFLNLGILDRDVHHYLKMNPKDKIYFENFPWRKLEATNEQQPSTSFDSKEASSTDESSTTTTTTTTMTTSKKSPSKETETVEEFFENSDDLEGIENEKDSSSHEKEKKRKKK